METCTLSTDQLALVMHQIHFFCSKMFDREKDKESFKKPYNLLPTFIFVKADYKSSSVQIYNLHFFL